MYLSLSVVEQAAWHVHGKHKGWFLLKESVYRLAGIQQMEITVLFAALNPNVYLTQVCLSVARQ